MKHMPGWPSWKGKRATRSACCSRPEAAQAECEKSMKVDPNRFNGLYGAGRAAELAHERGKAAAYQQLLKNCEGHTSARPSSRKLSLHCRAINHSNS